MPASASNTNDPYAPNNHPYPHAATPLPPDVNLGGSMLIAVWTMAGVSCVIMTMRMYTRLKLSNGKKLLADDYLMLLSLLLALTSSGMSIKSVDLGFGRHIEHIPTHQRSDAIKFQYLSIPFNLLAQALGRVSFAVSLIQLMGATISRIGLWSLYGLIVTQLILNGALITVYLSMCRPLERFWNPTHGSCWSPKVLEHTGYVTQSWNVFTDAVLAVFPAAMIWRLRIKVILKVGLVFLMGLGVFNMVAAVVTMHLSSAVESGKDITWDYVVMDIWGAVQTYLVIIAASAPAIRPLFRGILSRPKGNDEMSRADDATPPHLVGAEMVGRTPKEGEERSSSRDEILMPGDEDKPYL